MRLKLETWSWQTECETKFLMAFGPLLEHQTSVISVGILQTSRSDFGAFVATSSFIEAQQDQSKLCGFCTRRVTSKQC